MLVDVGLSLVEIIGLDEATGRLTLKLHLNLVGVRCRVHCCLVGLGPSEIKLTVYSDFRTLFFKFHFLTPLLVGVNFRRILLTFASRRAQCIGLALTSF